MNSHLNFKGQQLSVLSLTLWTADLKSLESELKIYSEENLGILENTPIIIKFSYLKYQTKKINLKRIVNLFKKYKANIIAVSDGNEEQIKQSYEAGLLILSSEKFSNSRQNIKIENKEKTEQNKNNFNNSKNLKPFTPLIIQHQVRSGQQIYANNRDLIVLSSIGAGAEAISDGNIYIYGQLRGRAIAGVKGNLSARIFTSSMQAQLVSIAGEYLVLDEDYNFVKKVKNKPAQVFLAEDGKLKIEII